MTRVLVADDDPDVRSALAAVIATDPGLHLVARAGDGREALSEARRHRPDVVLLDIRMPVLDGLATLERLRQQSEPPRVLILTTFGEGEYVRRAIAAGADGFLLKAGDPHHLLAAVHGTARGETWLSPTVARFLADEFRRSEGDRGGKATLARLTDRERDVVRVLARGLSNAEIGAELFLSESTVKAYLSSAMSRTGTRNRVELAALVWTTAHEAGPGA